MKNYLVRFECQIGEYQHIDYMLFNKKKSEWGYCKEFWGITKKDELKERYPTAPAYYNGYVVVCDSEGYTLWMNAQTGEFVYKSRLDKSRIIARSLRAADSLISYSSNGRVVAMRLK